MQLTEFECLSVRPTSRDMHNRGLYIQQLSPDPIMSVSAIELPKVHYLLAIPTGGISSTKEAMLSF